jgi:hypothetical protein
VVLLFSRGKNKRVFATHKKLLSNPILKPKVRRSNHPKGVAAVRKSANLRLSPRQPREVARGHPSYLPATQNFFFFWGNVVAIFFFFFFNFCISYKFQPTARPNQPNNKQNQINLTTSNHKKFLWPFSEWQIWYRGGWA